MTLANKKKSRLYYGYIIVAAAFFVTAMVYGAQYSFGVFFKPVLAEFGWTRAETSGAYSLYMVLLGFFGIFTGRLTDRFGPRKVVTVAGVFVGVGYLLISLTHALWQIYFFYGVLASAGAAGGWVPILTTVARWFDKQRGLMTGIVAAGIGVGTTIAPPVANRLITDHGWRTSYVVLGLLALVITVAAAQFLRRDPGPSAHVEPKRESLRGQQLQGFSPGEAMRTRQFWLIAVVFFACNFSLQTAMVHLVPHVTDMGVAAATAATVLSVIGAVSIGSKIFMGGVIDKRGNRFPMIVVLIIMIAVFLWLQMANQLWMFYLFAVVFAIGYGGFAAFQSPTIAEYFGLRAHGTIFGIITFGTYIGGAVGPLLAGWLYDIIGNYQIAFGVIAGLSALSLVLAILLTPTMKPAPVARPSTAGK